MREQRFRNTRHPENRNAIFALLLSGALLSGCFFNPEPPGGPLVAEVQGASAVSALQRVNERGLRCWIRSGDPDFSGLALVPELDTRTNDPRILIVKQREARGLPQLVISASDGEPIEITTFGPLTGDALSNRINADILAWSAGRQSCQ